MDQDRCAHELVCTALPLLRRWLTRWGRSFTHTEMAHVARVVTLVAQWRHLPGSPGLLRQPVPCIAIVAVPPRDEPAIHAWSAERLEVTSAEDVDRNGL